MNEIYKVIVNVLDIVKANNLFLVELERRIDAIEKSLVFEIPNESEPDVPGADEQMEQ